VFLELTSVLGVLRTVNRFFMTIRTQKSNAMLARVGIFAAALSFSAQLACAQSNLVTLISQPGDYVGGGQTYVTTNQSDIGLSGTPATITVTAFGYNIYFSGPGGANLTVATYTNAARWPFNGSSPGISVFGNGRGCNTVCGNFQILELHTDGSGNVDRLWVTFTHICECSFPPMTGEIRYNSQLAPTGPSSKTIRVPADYATIQAAIDNANLLAVDTVLVSPGVYNESISFKGKRVVVASTGGSATTIISPPSGSAAVSFTSGETSNSILAGFTLTNASTAISVSGASPTILSNILVNCGGGVSCNFASPTLLRNQIMGCSGSAVYLGGAATPLIESNIIRTNNGGVIMFAAGSPTIRNNLFQGNLGDALNMVNDSDADIIQNLILENTGNGIYWLVPSGARGPRVVNNTIVNNGAAGIFADGYDANALIANNIILGSPALDVGTFNDLNPPIVQFNDIFSISGAAYADAITNLTGIAGNISVDPFFTCLPGDDYHLLAGSPCIDAGTNGAPLLPTTDFDGNPRRQAGVTSQVARVDMGAFEFNPASPPVPCLYVTCPSNIIVTALPGENSAVVSYPSATGTPVAVITSTPPSGSVFPGGTNFVTCTATYGTNSVSATFTVVVLVPAAIASQSASTNVLAGQALSLSVSPVGTPPFSYRWMFENNDIPGALNPTLSIANVQSVNEGIYRAVVANSVGSITGALISVRVLASGPVIVSNPVSLSLPASSNAVLSVGVVGSEPLGYQWLFKGATLAGATAAQYQLNNVQSANQGAYQVVVANPLGSATSAVATITVTPLAPYFLDQPVSESVRAGSNGILSGLAAGSQPIGYQWRRNGTNLSGANQPSLVLSNVSLADSGPYFLVASNIVGVSTSAVAQVTVYESPTFLQGLTNQVVDFGSTVVLAVNAQGSPALSYTWQWNGQAVPGSGPRLTMTNIQLVQSGYYSVAATNQYGSISSTARLSVLGRSASVIAWGDNSGGQTNVPANLVDAVAVAGGDYHSVALRRDGRLVAWGYNGDGQTNVPVKSLRFVKVAAGAAHNLAIAEDGSVSAWGRNDAGQCNVGLRTGDEVLAVAAGDSHSLALLASGSVLGWGDNSFGQSTAPLGLEGVGAIAAGRNHSLALRNDGSVVGWGDNSYGQAVAPNLTNAVGIAAGYLHSVALLSNGQVIVWGDNSFGQANVPTGLSNVVSIAAGDFHCLALTTDGRVVGWGDNRDGQVDVPAGLANVLAVACGNYHALSLATPGSSLQVGLSSGRLVVSWNGAGKLQWAPTPAGPYSEIVVQGQGYTNQDMSAPAKFFRLKQ